MDSIDDISEIQTLVTPRPVLLESANTGIISLPVDPDGMLRLGYGAHSHQDVMYPAFATEIVRLYRRLHENDIHYKENSFTLGERRVPLRHGTFYINYSGERIEQLPFFLFVDPLFDLFSDTYFSGLKPGDEENPFDIKRLENSIVLMGATTGDLHDEYLSPISPSPIPGVEVHAHIINTLLSGRFLYHVNDSLQIWGTFFLSILLCAVCSISSIRTGILVSILGISCWVEGGAIAFLLGGYVVRLVAPPVCLILAVLATITYRYIFEEREKRYLKSLFSQATDSVLVDRLLDYPDAVKLGGDRRRITILFSDIRSFSTLSETMDPHDLVDFLNHYFTAVTDVIFKNNGMIDKFIGDAVMAIFGAPLPDEDHAYRACKTAVEMLEVQKQLSKARESEGSPPFRIGVGIHTGEVILGNLGSEKRSNYTCIGDAVNVASRIEGLNKTFYTELLISMDTCQECSQFLNVRPVGSSEIRGRKEKVELFELLSLKTPDAPG